MTVTREKDENSCVVEEMELIVCRSCLQKSKDVIFEGLSEKVWFWWWWRKEEEDEKGVERS